MSLWYWKQFPYPLRLVGSSLLDGLNSNLTSEVSILLVPWKRILPLSVNGLIDPLGKSKINNHAGFFVGQRDIKMIGLKNFRRRGWSRPQPYRIRLHIR